MPGYVLLGQVVQGSSDFGKILDKATIEIGKSPELLDPLDIGGSGPVRNTTDFDWVHANLSPADNHPEVFGFWHIPFTLLWFKEEIILLQSFEHFSCNSVVLLLIGGEDEDVIEIDRNLSFCNEISEDIVHYILEGGRGVGEPEKHDPRFVQASIGHKRGFPFVSCFDPDVVVTPTDVKLGEDGGIS